MQVLKEVISPSTHKIIPDPPIFLCERCGKEHDDDLPHGVNVNCPRCKGSGWMQPLKADGVDYRRVIPCPEPGCQNEYLGGHAPKVDIHGISQIQDFSCFRENPNNEEALAATKLLANGEAPYNLLTLFGYTGVGKSHLANAAARHWQQRGFFAKLYYLKDLIGYILDGIKDNTTEGRIRELSVIEFLVIDDWDVKYLGNSSPTFTTYIERIIENRIKNVVHTLITTNFPAKEFPDALRSRLKDVRWAHWSTIWGKDDQRAVEEEIRGINA